MYNNLFVTHFETLGQNVVRKNGGLRSSIAAVGELTNCPPGTEAKFIITRPKKSCLVNNDNPVIG